MKTIKILTYPLKLRSFDEQKQVFDPVRNKYVAFTPEEFVRQNMIMFMIQEKKYSKSLMAVEYYLKHMDTSYRCDIVIFNKKVQPRIIVECKAPGKKLTQMAIDQAARYNSKLHVEYLVITNGKETCCCRLNYMDKSFIFLEDLPETDIIYH